MKDYYKILDVDSSSTAEQIKIQYRLLLHAWHPDKFPTDELKNKAEEKLIEINEAFSILSDPAKRKAYDQSFQIFSSSIKTGKSSKPNEDKSKSHTERKATSSASQQTTNQDSSDYCQSCGLSSDTRYVELHQNIGVLIRRFHKSIKGNLCRPCINYYFWEFTGKTILFGWWGTISFIVTPFIIINNILHFIGSFGLKKSHYNISPSPAPFWFFSSIGGLLLIGALLKSLIFPSINPPTSQSNFASPTKFVVTSTSNSVIRQVQSTATKPMNTPKSTPTRFKTSTSVVPACYRWYEVTKSMIGRSICVYGNVFSIRSVGGSTTQILFSDSSESFFLASGTYYYDVVPGNCVAAQGKVLKSGAGIPYIDIDEALYKCESWMK